MVALLGVLATLALFGGAIALGIAYQRDFERRGAPGGGERRPVARDAALAADDAVRLAIVRV